MTIHIVHPGQTEYIVAGKQEERREDLGNRERRGRGRVGRGRVIVKTDRPIEAEIMYQVVVHCHLHDQVNSPPAPGDVGNNDSRQRTQPMTGRDGKVWNRDASLSHKKYPQDMIRHRVGMTAAG